MQMRAAEQSEELRIYIQMIRFMLCNFIGLFVNKYLKF